MTACTKNSLNAVCAGDHQISDYAAPHLDDVTQHNRPDTAYNNTLKIGILGSGVFTPLSSVKDTCYALGTSMRIIGAGL
jgi:hypothetical protein